MLLLSFRETLQLNEAGRGWLGGGGGEEGEGDVARGWAVFAFGEGVGGTWVAAAAKVGTVVWAGMGGEG